MQDFELKIEYVALDEIKPYERNAREHGDEDVAAIMASIQEFGFNDPIGVWNGTIVEGHGRLLAAEKLGLSEVPIIRLDHMTDEQRRAYALAHNKTAELSRWAPGLVVDELKKISCCDMSAFGFFDAGDLFFNREEKDFDKRQEGNEEYNQFLDKFVDPKTTDDCYTPENVYCAVTDWVAKEYNVNKNNFIRPFYPGGDYQKRKYKAEDIVVDNPPFSILSEILKYYNENNIRFFLFAPTLTLFSSSSSSCAIPCALSIIYENGATIQTSFLTNLEDEDLRVRTAPDLCAAVEEENTKNKKQMVANLPKYEYPDEIITAAMVARWSKYGVEYRLKKSCSKQISELDAQKKEGKSIYGNGYILSNGAAAERAAAERAAAKRWTLSEREKEIVALLSEND